MSDRVPPQPAKRRWGRWIGAGVGGFVAAGAIALFVALMVAQAADDRVGCGSVDPTDPANYSTDYIRNDTSSPVIIDDCRGDYCRSDQQAIQLSRGRQIGVDAACAQPARFATSWRVRRPNDGVLGYITIVTPRKTDGLVFRVSAASAKRGAATPPQRG